MKIIGKLKLLLAVMVKPVVIGAASAMDVPNVKVQK